MKTKKLLLALPMVATIASCSARVDVFRDIFKDARAFSEDEREAIIENLDTRQYRYDGTRSIVTYLNNEEIGRQNNTVQVYFANDEEDHDIGFDYSLDENTKYSAYYDNESSQWYGHSVEGVSFEDLYYKFQGLVYSWNGHILTGNFDVAPYSYNTKLLNAVSRHFSKQQVKNVKTGNFSFNLGSSASYSDGEIKHQVTKYKVTYVDHRITHYECNYSIIVDEADIRIELTYNGNFDYEYIH